MTIPLPPPGSTAIISSNKRKRVMWSGRGVILIIRASFCIRMETADQTHRLLHLNLLLPQHPPHHDPVLSNYGLPGSCGLAKHDRTATGWGPATETAPVPQSNWSPSPVYLSVAP